MVCVDKKDPEYRIEVSGWDVEYQFFVEQTALEWNERAKKTVLHRRVNQGALLFVRLAGNSDANASPSIPHEAVTVDRRGGTRPEYEVSLHSFLRRRETQSAVEF